MHNLRTKKICPFLTAVCLTCALTPVSSAFAQSADVQSADVRSIDTPSTDAQSVSAVEISYQQITMDEASEVFSGEGPCLIIDVRTPEEYDSGHIPGAVNLPKEVIENTNAADEEALSVLPDPGQTLYIYCRSGNRSKLAAEKLSSLGYKNVIECGGILDWKGELEINTPFIYCFGNGVAQSEDETLISVTPVDDHMLRLSAFDGELTKDVNVSEEDMNALFSLITDNMSHLEHDMSHTCLADSGYAYLYYKGEQYGGYYVQNSWFKEVQRAIRAAIGQENLDAFKDEMKSR